MHYNRVASTAAFLVLSAAIGSATAPQERGKGREGKPEGHQGRPQEAAPRAQQPRVHAEPQRGPAREQQRRPEQEHQRSAPPPQVQRPPQQQQQQRAHDQRQPQQERQRREEQRVQPAPQRTQRQAREWQQQRGWVRNGGWQGPGNNWQNGRARHWESEHRTWVQRGGYGGYYIPRDRYVQYFGPQHFFRIRQRPIIYMGYPRFYYSGFSFLLVDPWPEYWVENWYDTDDVYIEYDDGYYLYNRRYPRVRLAITVFM